jgi:hypothetical protein
MAVSIARGSGRISVTSRPRPNRPHIDVAGDLAIFDGAGMAADGEVTLNGGAADSTVGWQVGWVQAQWIETNWCYYRGQFNNHGSAFIQRARPPARPRQSCRDTSGPVGDIFTILAAPELVSAPAGPFPIRVRVSTSDPPGDNCDLVVTNTLTGELNFLREVQLEFHFCTVLTVQDPAGAFHHQASFYWNVHWQARFQPTGFPAPTPAQWTITPVAGGTSGAVSGVIAGPPTDRRFAGVLTTAQSDSCNDLAAAAATASSQPSSVNRRQSHVWANFDVRR